MFDNTLALMTGVDIPIVSLQTTLHQPTLLEISRIGDTDFFTGVQLLCLQKEDFIKDGALASQTTNLQLLLRSLNEPSLADKKDCVEQVLFMLFPLLKQVIILPGSILLNFGESTVNINEENFDEVQQVLKRVFCLDKRAEDDFNPANSKAAEIAKKLQRGRKRIAAEKSAQDGGNALVKQISILTVGLQSMSLQDCCNLTFFQLQDLTERFQLYRAWDIDIRAKLAGSTDNKSVDDWTKNIHN